MGPGTVETRLRHRTSPFQYSPVVDSLSAGVKACDGGEHLRLGVVMGVERASTLLASQSNWTGAHARASKGHMQHDLVTGVKPTVTFVCAHGVSGEQSLLQAQAGMGQGVGETPPAMASCTFQGPLLSTWNAPGHGCEGLSLKLVQRGFLKYCPCCGM